MKILRSTLVPTSSSVMFPQLAADTSDDSNIDLQLLGVSADTAKMSPSVTRYPQAFAREASQVWNRMFQVEQFQKDLRKQTTAPGKWKLAIQTFLRMCRTDGVAPFASSRNHVDNSSLISFLTTSRLRLVQFFDDSKLLETLRIIRGSQSRKYDTGFARFSLSCVASVKSPFKSAEEIGLFLKQFGFSRGPGGSFKKILSTNTVVFVLFTSPTRVSVIYEIRGCQSVFIGNHEAPTKKQVSSFCDQIIWLPIVRSHRIKALGTHTLF